MPTLTRFVRFDEFRRLVSCRLEPRDLDGTPVLALLDDDGRPLAYAPASRAQPFYNVMFWISQQTYHGTPFWQLDGLVIE